MRRRTGLVAALAALAITSASAQENYESWPPLKSTFESTGGGGFVIKGYDPVIRPNGTCVTTFMAVEPGADPKVYPNFIEFEAVAAQEQQELERRLAAHTACPEDVVSWEEVKAQALARARR